MDTVFGNILSDHFCLNRWDGVGLLDEHTCICSMLLEVARKFFNSYYEYVTTGIGLATLVPYIKWFN